MMPRDGDKARREFELHLYMILAHLFKFGELVNSYSFYGFCYFGF